MTAVNSLIDRRKEEDITYISICWGLIRAVNSLMINCLTLPQYVGYRVIGLYVSGVTGDTVYKYVYFSDTLNVSRVSTECDWYTLL